MKTARFACLFLFLAAPIFGQSTPSSRISELFTTPKLSRMLRRAAVGIEPNVSQVTSRPVVAPPPAKGLNFAPVFGYDSGGYGSVSVAVADVNGDGKADIVAVNGCASGSNGHCTDATGAIAVLTGNGDGTFQTAITYDSGGKGSFSIAVADVNGDGKPDMLVTNYCGNSNFPCDTSGSVGVLLGNGDGTFRTAVTYDSGGYMPVSLAVADVNGDGKPDFLVVNNCAGPPPQTGVCQSGSLSVLVGNGNGTFQAAVTSPAGYYPTFVAAADVNGDGKADVVMLAGFGGTGGGPNLGVLLSNGDGSFQTAITYYLLDSTLESVAVADVNGDGKPDLLVTNYAGNENGITVGEVDVLLGHGDGTFQEPVVYSTGGSDGGYGTYQIAVADLNGDGKPDLVVQHEFSCSPGPNCPNGSEVSVLIGNGDGTFQRAVTFGPVGFSTGSVAVGDLNGDGRPDILVGSTCVSASNCDHGGVGVLINTTPTTTTVLVSSPNPSNFGQSVSFTTTVTSQGFNVTPTGTVTFLDRSTSTTLGTSTLNTGGVATLQTSSLGPSAHGIIATYSGDTNFFSSVSPVVSQVVLGAAAKFSPTSVAFGNETVGTSSSPQSITLTNTGDIPLTFNSITITGTNPASFRQTNNCSPSIAGGSTCTISLTFDPTAADARTAAVTISDNAPSKVQKVPLTGVGVQATTTTALDSSLNPSNSGEAVMFTATVTSGSTVTPTGIVAFFDTATGTNLGSSSLNSIGVASIRNSTLGPSTHSIIATYQGDANFTSSSSPALSQVVLGAAAKFLPTSLAFGNQTVAISSSAQTITLKNTGDIPLAFNSITFTGTNPTNFTQTNNCGTSLAGGATCTFSVTFKPTATGARSAALTLSDNAPSKLQKVPVSGVGVLPAVVFSPTSLTFSTQVIYTTSKAQTVTLTNSGVGILNISNITASAQFSQTNNCGATVAPGGTCTLTVKFQPTALDTIPGSISVNDNALASPQALPLTGVATAIQLTPVGVSFGNQPVGTKSLAKTVTVSNKSHQTINISRIAIRGADPSDFPFISSTCGASLSSGSSCFIKVAFKPTVTGKRTATVAVSDDGGGEVQRAGLAGTGT